MAPLTMGIPMANFHTILTLTASCLVIVKLMAPMLVVARAHKLMKMPIILLLPSFPSHNLPPPPSLFPNHLPLPVRRMPTVHCAPYVSQSYLRSHQIVLDHLIHGHMCWAHMRPSI